MSGISSALLLALLLPGDIIHLKNGGRIAGIVLEEDEERVIVSVPGGQMTFARKDVAWIEREDPTVYYLREGERLIESGRYATAARELNKALGGEFDGQAREKLNEALAGLFRVRLREGLLDAAEAILRELPREAEVAYSLKEEVDKQRAFAHRLKIISMRLAERGDHVRAVELAERAIARDRAVRAQAGPYIFAACVKLGDEALRLEDYQRAYERFKMAARYGEAKTDILSPRLVSARLPHVLGLISAGRLREAKSALDSLLDEAPSSKAALYVKGRLFELMGRSGEASAIYARALSMELAGGRRPELAVILREELELALGYVQKPAPREEPTGEWRSCVSEHFEVFHQGSDLADRISATAETALAKAMAWLGMETPPEARTEIRVYPDSRSYVDATGQPEWSGGVSGVETKALGFRAQDIATFATCQRLLSSVVPHEVGHVALNAKLRRRTLPLALQEGFAIHMESSGRRNFLRSLARERHASGKLQKLPELLTAREYPEDVESFYAEACSVFEFLDSKLGEEGMRDFLLEWAAMGATVALKSAGYDSIQHLEEAWVATLW